MNDNEYIQKRLIELSNRAFERNYNTFSDFLNVNQISILNTAKVKSPYKLYGGYKFAERCVAGFGYDINDYEYPIDCIMISPAQQKFADKLTHRDFLGALMNLGINRETIGDIVIIDNVGYMFCLNTITQYVIDGLNRIKHTTVKCTKLDEIPNILSKEPESVEINATSSRIDVIISAVYNLSRNKSTQLINQEKVFINNVIAYKDSLMLKDGDIVSARGYGKFIFCGIIRDTKKGKHIIEVKKYR